LVLLFTGLCLLSCSSLRVYRPSFLLILVDALRADRLGSNGYRLDTTPAIDQLAAEGVTFTSAFAHSTWTKPSIATLFTSLYPSQHGISGVGVETETQFLTDVLDFKLATMAGLFEAAGYATCAVVNQIHLQPELGFAHGFDRYDWSRGRRAEKLNRDLERWLEGLEGGPFFAYLHYLDVHWPYNSRLTTTETPFGSTAMEKEPPHRADRIDSAWLSTLEKPENLSALEARYDHEVAYIDYFVGQLMETLKGLDLFEDTIVVVISDHGEGFLEHGRLQHGYAPYDEVLRIPWIHRLPRRLRTVTGPLEQPVGLIDLLPTLLEQAGLTVPPDLEGRSAVPLLTGGRPGNRLVFAETDSAFAVRSATHKLIQFVDGRTEFYDLAADPGEQTPLACEGPCGDLDRRVKDFRRKMMASRETREGPRAPLTPEEVDELRSLGYL
jgi:arylsulfatase A-like enzyme